MPKTTAAGQPKKDELPSTLQRSDASAQRTFTKAHDSAVETYGEGQRAHRVAYAALKHSYEKIGDHSEPKRQRGPSDPRAKSGGPRARGATGEGVDLGESKQHLMDVARRLNIRGRSSMSKGELASAIKKANRRETATARRS